MVSKNQIKLIQQLHQKKYRNLYDLFIVEGEKGVNEFLEASLELHSLFHTEAFVLKKYYDQAVVINDKELRKISQLKTPNKVLAIFKKPLETKIKDEGLTVVLDNVQDPGNLGTIIRLCDWFKVTQIICSTETVDCYNAKVVQATMGSLARLSIIYTDIVSFLNNTKRPCFAAVMEGKNVYTQKLPQRGVLVMGNEANGISLKVIKTIDNPIAIPRFNNNSKPESLNVATATAILLSEFRR
jgi:RNA methyltransferase, TrmH family